MSENKTDQNPALSAYVLDTINKIREPLALDRWSFHFESGEMAEDARAACVADPEYREATLYFDFDRFKTGDDVDEIVVHEVTHCHTWGIHTFAEGLADAVADSLPESHREAVRKLLREEVRKYGEQVTVDVSQTYLRLLRRAGVLAKP